MFASPSLNSDGEETNTADNFNDIYYSLRYEADLLFTRFVRFSESQQIMHVEKEQVFGTRMINSDNHGEISPILYVINLYGLKPR